MIPLQKVTFKKLHEKMHNFQYDYNKIQNSIINCFFKDNINISIIFSKITSLNSFQKKMKFYEPKL